MAVTPDSEVRLLKCPLQLSNKNQLTFANASEQYNYFNSLPKLIEDNFSYQRKDSVIRFPAHIDSLLSYNYVMYQNENYSNKWFYAFIVNMTYVNDSMTNIYIITDSWQTYQFDLIYKKSFIEREMINVNDDLPGANLIPEGLEIGEPIIDGTAEILGLNPLYVVAYAGDPNRDGVYPDIEYGYSHIVNGISTGIAYAVGTKTGLITILNEINQANMQDKIISIFTIPALAMLGWRDFTLENITNLNWSHRDWIMDNMNTNGRDVTLMSRPNTLNGYTPRNKKLLTYPYLYLGFTAPNSPNVIYRYENFTNGTPQFAIRSEINPNPNVYFIPKYYKNDTINVSESATLTGYPTTGFMTDYFNSWLAQNQQFMQLDLQKETSLYAIDKTRLDLANQEALIDGMSGIIDNIAKGKIGSALTSDISAIYSITGNNLSGMAKDVNYEHFVSTQMAQQEVQKLVPNRSSFGSSSTLLGYNLLNDNIFTRYSIKSQFAQRIDNYFDMYGYLTNTLKLPNINNRPNWNFVKTLGINLIANIPQGELEAIKNMFNNGVTLWHNPNTFLDYSQNNR